MKTDLYTKIILTIIALCLIFSVVRELGFLPENRIIPVKNIGTVEVEIQKERIPIGTVGEDALIEVIEEPIEK
ncbi:hypothetical protein [Flavobacterium sp.]|uniref:hypothetical protein n=1 Tax=Flavobacterium sp. TaxID=239 RepID=UPI00286AD203|nr:hypothetical protein [Flavobacterium sp.]